MLEKPWTILKSLWDWADRVHGLVVAIPTLAAFIAGIWQNRPVIEIFGWTAIVALAVSVCSLIWLEIHARISRPRVVIYFHQSDVSCRLQTQAYGPTQEARTYIRVRVSAIGRRSAKGCLGRLIAAYQPLSETNWGPNILKDVKTLRWVDAAFDPIDIHPRISHNLDICFEGSSVKGIRIADYTDGLSTLSAFSGQVPYVFHIAVTDESNVVDEKYLRILPGPTWEQLTAELISKP